MVDVSSGRKALKPPFKAKDLLPDMERIRAQTRADREARNKVRDAKNKASAAAKVAKPATTAPRNSANAMPVRMPGGGQSIPGQARSGFGAPSTSSHGGGTSSLVPASASRNADVAPPMTITPTSAVASSFRKGQAIGARKVATKAATKAAKVADTTVKGFTPSPSGTKRPSLLERNKANIQSKALERMKKSGRKG